MNTKYCIAALSILKMVYVHSAQSPLDNWEEFRKALPTISVHAYATVTQCITGYHPTKDQLYKQLKTFPTSYPLKSSSDLLLLTETQLHEGDTIVVKKDKDITAAGSHMNYYVAGEHVTPEIMPCDSTEQQYLLSQGTTILVSKYHHNKDSSIVADPLIETFEVEVTSSTY